MLNVLAMFGFVWVVMFRLAAALWKPVSLASAHRAGGFPGTDYGVSSALRIEDKIASAKAFNDRFRKLNGGKVPSDYGALGYSGVKTLLMGAKAADSVDADKVIAAVEALKYDYYKGPQYYRKCDHQSVQSVLIIESKPADPKNDADVFNLISTEEPNEANLRTCEALGHKA